MEKNESSTLLRASNRCSICAASSRRRSRARRIARYRACTRCRSWMRGEDRSGRRRRRRRRADWCASSRAVPSTQYPENPSQIQFPFIISQKWLRRCCGRDIPMFLTGYWLLGTVSRTLWPRRSGRFFLVLEECTWSQGSTALSDRCKGRRRCPGTCCV